ncbi:M23 family metallopeptidase [Streptomyces sp. NPDC046261]|uniref:M23 family metallopeptidase n=1 Tax=Streptomyces sp. NPDC046261 TaxID=3157200 RepID=UPI0033EE73D7
MLHPYRSDRPGRSLRRVLRALRTRPVHRHGGAMLCALCVAVAPLPASDSSVVVRAPERLARVSSEVLRLAREAGWVRQRYERGLRVAKDRKAQADRLAKQLHGQRVFSAVLREDAGAVARAQYRTGGFIAPGSAEAAAEPLDLLELQATDSDRRERLARMVIEADHRGRRLAADQMSASASWQAVDADVTQLRTERKVLEERLAQARDDLNRLADAAIRNQRCTPVDLDGLQGEVQDGRNGADGAAAISPSGWTRPLLAYELTAGFGGVGAHWANGHSGQDFAVPTGTPVRSVGAGTVTSIGCGGPFGISMVVRHESGWFSQYAHLAAPLLAPGRQVRAGEWIGLSGTTGNSTGPHLHFEIRRSAEFGTAVDPVEWLRTRGVPL